MTTTITIPRAVAQQALEALEYENSWHKPRNEKPYVSTLDAITALRAALAQPEQEPVTYTTGHCENKKQKGGCQLHNLQCGWPDCDRRTEKRGKK